MSVKFAKSTGTYNRKMYVVYGNSGTEGEPKWHAIGRRVSDSSAENDWGEETVQDILGSTWVTAKIPTITQTFDPLPLDGTDEYVKHVWELAIGKQDAEALVAQDLLRVHLYAEVDGGSGDVFAERFPASLVKVDSLGGEGGGNLGMPISVTFGGERAIGKAKVAEGEVTFTADPDVLNSEAV